MRRSICMLIVFLASPTVLASEFTCRANNEIRMITVEYEHKDWQVPCRVKYEKLSESLTEYPWSAQGLGWVLRRQGYIFGSQTGKLGLDL